MNVSGDACVAHMIAARAPLDNDDGDKMEETSNIDESSNDDDDKMEDVELGVEK